MDQSESVQVFVSCKPSSCHQVWRFCTGIDFLCVGVSSASPCIEAVFLDDVSFVVCHLQDTSQIVSVQEADIGFSFFFDEDCRGFIIVSSYIEPFLRSAAVAMRFIVSSEVIPCVYGLSLFVHFHPYPVEQSIVGEFCPSVSFLYPCGPVCGSISHLQSAVYAGFLFRRVSRNGIGSVWVGIYHFSCIPFPYDVSVGCVFHLFPGIEDQSLQSIVFK
ncbi:hypothetical protein EVA_05034 [gut metagenome]|uniref:Uncharacterized protein n=1 Tax=gut metagenome TaxID=749906 RepID=J9D2K6_9ZZZZ